CLCRQETTAVARFGGDEAAARAFRSAPDPVARRVIPSHRGERAPGGEAHAVARMGAGEALGKVMGLLAAEPRGDAEESLARAVVEDAADRALLKIEAVLVEPALRFSGMEDIERDRQRICGQLGVNVAMR